MALPVALPPQVLPMPLVSEFPENAKTIHLMGVAGTAMGALAGLLADAGYTVTGSDKAVYPPMSTYLEKLGIDVMEGFLAKNLDHKPDLVIVGNVMRAVYEESVALLASDLPYMSFPSLLGSRFIADAHSIVVAGTHGKTTTTAVTAWLLASAGLNPGCLVGGIAKNFDRTAFAGAGTHFVVEGDEYDTAFFDKGPKFLHYRPNTAILTSIEFDHADIYRDLAHVRESFDKLVSILPEDGLLIARTDHSVVRETAAASACEVWGYGEDQLWDGRMEDVDTTRGVMHFTVLRDGKSIGSFESSLVGEHNLYNQVAAAAAATRAGLSPEQLAQGFATFKGIKRRQEVIGQPGDVTVVDDFAHHPTAVSLTLQALRKRFGQRRLWAVWEPRSATSRRNTFQTEYARSFGDADRVVIARPYDQSGIPEDERFSSDQLVRDLADRGIDAMELDGAEAITAVVAAQAQPHDVIAVLSNGGFGGLHKSLLERLEQRLGGAS
ncbi:MAG: UDP-N-acetylmuramate: L-alanyl-gamma-D-glutamyl-meso-diaminopimelate ligase [Myxococcota bacterium]|jgi:UDP-N-acetylmuramate: L-alanyl-gamma-D-glutamyl-meso-diaminopimelate ligase